MEEPLDPSAACQGWRSRRERPGPVPRSPRAAVRAAGMGQRCPAVPGAAVPGSAHCWDAKVYPALLPGSPGPRSGGFRGTGKGLHCCMPDACSELCCASDALPSVGLWQLRQQAKRSMGSSAALPCRKRPLQHPQFLDPSLLTAPQHLCPSSRPWPLRHHRTHPNMWHCSHVQRAAVGSHEFPWYVPTLQGHRNCQCLVTAQQRPVGLRTTPEPAPILHRCSCWFPNNLNCFQHPLPCLGSVCHLPLLFIAWQTVMSC